MNWKSLSTMAQTPATHLAIWTVKIFSSNSFEQRIWTCGYGREKTNLGCNVLFIDTRSITSGWGAAAASYFWELSQPNHASLGGRAHSLECWNCRNTGCFHGFPGSSPIVIFRCPFLTDWVTDRHRRVTVLRETVGPSRWWYDSVVVNNMGKIKKSGARCSPEI